MGLTVSGWNWRIFTVAALLPFVCMLALIIATGDRSTEPSFPYWEKIAFAYAVLASLLIPLVFTGTHTREWMLKIRSSITYVVAWMGVQCAGILVLAVFCLMLYGDDMLE